MTATANASDMEAARKELLAELLEFAAFATVGDVMELRDLFCGRNAVIAGYNRIDTLLMCLFDQMVIQPITIPDPMRYDRINTRLVHWFAHLGVTDLSKFENR